MEQAQRISSESYVDENILQVINSADLDAAFNCMEQENISHNKDRQIGYK
jgi:hypothetical protein